MIQTVWHYTIGTHAAEILSDGLIKGATEGLPAGERPIVWFSTRQIWEPTATKGMIVGGTRRDATMQEMIDEGGLWRFGISLTGLLTWRQIQQAANMTRDTARGLERAAKRAGADPASWYGSLEPVPVTQCVIECRLKIGDDWGDVPDTP